MLGRKKKLDQALAQHLDQRGIRSEFWLNSAKDAITACESGDSVAPIFSGGGPVPARTVVTLLAIEAFVDGPIDWETPLIDGSERGQWFFPPSDDMLLEGKEAHFSEIALIFFPTGDEEDVRWVDSRPIE